MCSELTSREAALLAELQHRVRNTLATTRMIARRSAETSESLEEYVAHLDGRLAAIANVQNAAIRDPTAGIDLHVLVLDEITSAGLATSEQLRISGPTLPIHPRAAEPIALAFHELMTNALKFGALSVPEGQLAILWQVQSEISSTQRLVFDWVETGMHLIEEYRRHGFGSIVLLDMLKHNFGAKTSMRFESTGLACQIICPLNERTLASTNNNPPRTKEDQLTITRAYQSSSGDTWDLIHDNETTIKTVRHTPNAASGGLASELPLNDFFELEPHSPQHRAVERLLGGRRKSTDWTKSSA